MVGTIVLGGQVRMRIRSKVFLATSTNILTSSIIEGKQTSITIMDNITPDQYTMQMFSFQANRVSCITTLHHVSLLLPLTTLQAVILYTAAYPMQFEEGQEFFINVGKLRDCRRICVSQLRRPGLPFMLRVLMNRLMALQRSDEVAIGFLNAALKAMQRLDYYWESIVSVNVSISSTP